MGELEAADGLMKWQMDAIMASRPQAAGMAVDRSGGQLDKRCSHRTWTVSLLKAMTHADHGWKRLAVGGRGMAWAEGSMGELCCSVLLVPNYMKGPIFVIKY